MWQQESTHVRGESEFLDQAIERLLHDQELLDHADAHLNAVTHMEPLIAESMRTPQDIRYHAEGPFMRDHLRLMLVCLYALVEDKLHLIDLEEFRQMKGYEGEIEELEQIIKEYVSLFEVFILCHDVGKWKTARFEARPRSRGQRHGFVRDRSLGHAEAVVQRKNYLELFEQYAEQHRELSDQHIQANFYHTYEIDVHYPGHARLIHLPVYAQLLDRVCEAHQLTERDRAMVEDIISHHIDIIRDFEEPDSKKVRRYIHLANRRGYDSDDFIDLAQAALFLDTVCGSARHGAKGPRHDAVTIQNFLRAEHNYDPARRMRKISAWEQKRQEQQFRLFREVGLDGSSLMKLLSMQPGPAFGSLLKQIQDAIVGRTQMPALDTSAQKEIEKRAGRFYQKSFVKGE